MTINTYNSSYVSTKLSVSATECLTLEDTYLKQVPDLKTKSQLHKIIIGKNNSPDYLAINIYWDTLRSWYNPKKTYAKDGNILYIRKLKTKGIYLYYAKLSKIHGTSREIIRQKLVKLEVLGLINRSFQHKETVTTKSFNRLIIYVWKQTPHFFNEYGIDKNEVKELVPQTNYKYISEKYKTDFKTKPLQIKALIEGEVSNQLKDTKKLIKPFSIEKDRYLGKSNFYDNSFSSNSLKIEVIKSAPIPNKQLRDFYPLNESDCRKLNILSSRNFTLRAMNEILLDMSNKLKDRWFKGKKSFLNYVSLAFRYEKRTEELINRESYRIRNNYTNEENNIKEQEDYLTEIEYSLEVSPEWHFKKRLAAVFTRDKAYKLLTSYIRIEIDNGVFKLYLSKSLELSKFDYEILLNQAKSTHETVCSESLEYKEITKFEIINPIINTENKHSNNKTEMYEGLWGRVRKQLIEYFGSDGKGLDRSWFSKLSADIDESNKVVRLKAPTNFIKDWIYQNHFHKIERLFKDEDYQCQLLTN